MFLRYGVFTKGVTTNLSGVENGIVGEGVSAPNNCISASLGIVSATPPVGHWCIAYQTPAATSTVQGNVVIAATWVFDERNAQDALVGSVPPAIVGAQV